ncbi:MAG: DUF4115 domain-containing protein, partial [Chitinivibrionales bacterium]|nr:DUF4115 domain-containing protein [Chitinivibrionales bacterium]MBD3358953.1 DUF4115 domain-containing protein [Chitinivibrionales bacterium]
KRYCEDRGVPHDQYERERADTLTIKVNERESSPISWIIVGLVIVVLVILSFVANQAGWIRSSEAVEAETTTDTTSVPGAEAPDDSAGTVDVPVGESIEVPLLDGEDPDEAEENEAAVPLHGEDSLSLVVTAVRDSAWAQVFTDGDTWKNFLKAGDSRVFHAADSLNIHVGNNDILRYTLNGETLPVKGKGIVYFKVDHDGVTYWRYGKWQEVFGGRL